MQAKDMTPGNIYHVHPNAVFPEGFTILVRDIYTSPKGDMFATANGGTLYKLIPDTPVTPQR